LLVGQKNSGKSHTCASIAKKLNISKWVVFCGTKKAADFWATKFESSVCVKGFDAEGEAYLKKLIRYQQKKIHSYKIFNRKLHDRNLPENKKVSSLGIIFDEIPLNRAFRDVFEDLIPNARCYLISIISCCQSPKQVPPAVLSNTDYLFLMDNTEETCKLLFEEYVDAPETFRDFLEILRAVTENKDALGGKYFYSLVYDNVVKSTKIEDVFKVFRNEDKCTIDDIKLGSLFVL